MRLTNEELIALAAVVNQQTVLMDAENKSRLDNGLSAAYEYSRHGLTREAEMLQNEIHQRVKDDNEALKFLEEE